MLATPDKDSELISSCGAMIRQSADALLARAQEAGDVRPDARSADLIRLVHAVSMAMQYPQADDGQADRMIGLIVDGLRSAPGAEGRE